MVHEQVAVDPQSHVPFAIYILLMPKRYASSWSFCDHLISPRTNLPLYIASKRLPAGSGCRSEINPMPLRETSLMITSLRVTSYAGSRGSVRRSREGVLTR